MWLHLLLALAVWLNSIQQNKKFRYKYKPYIVKNNSMILFRCISYTVSFSDMFRLESWAIFRLIIFLNKIKYTISSDIVIVTYEISYSFIHSFIQYSVWRQVQSLLQNDAST